MKKRTPISTLISYVLMSILGIFIVISFRPNFEKIYELRTHLSLMKQKLLLEEKRNYFLKKEFNGLSNDPKYIEEVAREKLGWCRPTETVYRFQTHTPNPAKGGTKGKPSDSDN